MFYFKCSDLNEYGVSHAEIMCLLCKNAVSVMRIFHIHYRLSTSNRSFFSWIRCYITCAAAAAKSVLRATVDIPIWILYPLLYTNFLRLLLETPILCKTECFIPISRFYKYKRIHWYKLCNYMLVCIPFCKCRTISSRKFFATRSLLFTVRPRAHVEIEYDTV